MVHLRAHDQGKLYIQEVVNRLFEDSEARIREHGVSRDDEQVDSEVLNEWLLICIDFSTAYD